LVDGTLRKLRIIFTAPSGNKYGYFDGWQPDGCFHYTGEGQIGDQQLKQGNRALVEHTQANKSVRLFRREGKWLPRPKARHEEKRQI
jgi:hypothetical protein